MLKRLFTIGRLAALVVTACAPGFAQASSTTVRGTIVRTEGHEAPACRTVTLKRKDNGTLMFFRIPATGAEDGILSVTLTSLTANLEVDLTFDPAITTGCGSDPKISYIALLQRGS